jgi:hypothetical protein
MIEALLLVGSVAALWLLSCRNLRHVSRSRPDVPLDILIGPGHCFGGVPSVRSTVRRALARYAEAELGAARRELEAALEPERERDESR